MNERLVIEKDVKTLLKMEQKNYIAYLRQSTVKQELSGLGIEAQREIIRNYLKDKKAISEYIETESGKKSDRPKLIEALSECRKTGATLIVAKLDRLSRNVAFTSKLLESDVEIVFCDFPEANKLGFLSRISKNPERRFKRYVRYCKTGRTRQAAGAGKHPPKAAVRCNKPLRSVYAVVRSTDAGGGRICSAGTDRRMGQLRHDAAAGGRRRLCAGGRRLLCCGDSDHCTVLSAQK